MENEKDCYEIIGTVRDACYKNVETGRKRDEIEQDNFLKSKFEQAIKRLEQKLKFVQSQKEIEEINKRKEEIKQAYERIKNPYLRKVYNEEQDEKNKKSNKRKGTRKKTAYDILRIARSSFEFRNEATNNSILEERKEKLSNELLRMITLEISSEDKKNIEAMINEIEENYELIKTEELRKEYNAQLEKEKHDEIMKIREEQIKDKYCHISEYNEAVIDTLKNGKIPREKAVAKRLAKNSPIIYLRDKRNIRLRKISEIAFRNCTGISTSYVNGYEVTRNINGKEKKDTIYTNLSLPELGINEETGEPVNKEYYDCVANRLLSEDMIEGSRYNDGYIGMVEKNKNGTYDTTLGEEKLNPSEQEMLTAVMIIKEREEVNIEGDVQEVWEK